MKALRIRPPFFDHNEVCLYNHELFEMFATPGNYYARMIDGDVWYFSRLTFDDDKVVLIGAEHLGDFRGALFVDDAEIEYLADRGFVGDYPPPARGTPELINIGPPYTFAAGVWRHPEASHTLWLTPGDYRCFISTGAVYSCRRVEIHHDRIVMIDASRELLDPPINITVEQPNKFVRCIVGTPQRTK
jgi:hypothetical protein